MPCQSDPPSYNEQRDIWYREFAHDSELAEILCDLMGLLEASNFPVFTSRSLDWWAAHKRIDEMKREKELRKALESKTKTAALAKLTTKERELLGLK